MARLQSHLVAVLFVTGCSWYGAGFRYYPGVAGGGTAKSVCRVSCALCHQNIDTVYMCVHVCGCVWVWVCLGFVISRMNNFTTGLHVQDCEVIWRSSCGICLGSKLSTEWSHCSRSWQHGIHCSQGIESNHSQERISIARSLSANRVT